MGWFNKKEKIDEKGTPFKRDNLPPLPQLPELPPLKDFREESTEPLHKLPSFPNNSFGQKFSQNAIKEAVSKYPKQNFDIPTGKKGERVFEADDFESPKKGIKMMQKPSKPIKKEFTFPKTEEIEESEEEFDLEDFEEEPTFEEPEEFDPEFKKETEFQQEQDSKKFESEENIPFRREPVFIRIDKFEDALKTFEKTKKEVSEIEKALRDISTVREDENKELESWQNEVVKVKEQIEKVDKDIFSRIE
ncbi:MAG: hypothetical protein ABIH59_03565 [archaeon]